MAKFDPTLGPFRIECPPSSSGFGRAIYAERASGPDVFVAYVGNWKQDPQKEVSDAQLFANALGMYSVLKRAREILKEEADNRADAGSDFSDYAKEPRDLVEEIDAIIASTEGRKCAPIKKS